MIGQLMLVLAMVIALAGAIQDVRTRRISNWLCLALGAAAFISSVISYDLNTVLGSLGHSAFALVVGMLLFRWGMIGGGDAKFYAAAALGVPLSRALAMLGWTSIGGVGLLLTLMVYVRIKGRLAGPRDEKNRAMLPYGVAIFVGFAGAMGGQLAGLLP